MKQCLWTPSEDRIRSANMTRFLEFARAKHGRRLDSYRDLYDWSVECIPDFWDAMWAFAQIRTSQPYQQVVDDLAKFPGARWFVGARLNFAENLLRYRDQRVALVARDELPGRREMTYAELYATVARLAQSLREMGVGPGDRVAAYMPNRIETAVAMLAATSVGAVWCSCATDIGPHAVADRFGQIEPRILFAVDGYVHKGQAIDGRPNVRAVAAAIPGLEKVIIVGARDSGSDVRHPFRAVRYEDLLGTGPEPPLVFEQLPADHPVFIMFSSGTTGKPKCIVQGAGGVLVNHLKELLLHTDLAREDRIIYLTTCSWMMWNWLLSALGVGATVILYDGSPVYPRPGALWKLAQDERVSVFGLSASYVNLLRSEDARPGQDYDLSALRAISQTGSALSAEGFAYVYREIKADIHFNSMSGGTDINGCFAIGSPIQPVYAGELQGPALGMKVKAYDERGVSVWDRQGELVCEAPAPSMPLCLWNDPRGEKYRAAYFEHYPGVWRHGDYVTLHSDTGGITFHGRADAVLKPSGVRIGTAEIYAVVETLPEIADSLAIGQKWEDDERIVLFVKPAPGRNLTTDLQRKIRQALRERASPRHVPAVILEMPDAPYTLNMKKVEIAVTQILHGRPVSNRDALLNPEVLDYFIRVALQLRPAAQRSDGRE
jgi:acetoacetyl-CoA synthetase